MSISASMVRELREKTNAGMMDCKKALEETKGNFEQAVEWLRKKGLASAAKKADRLASEGAVIGLVKNSTGVLVEINSETDFVAKNDEFKALAQQIVQHVASLPSIPNDASALLETSMGTQSLSERLKTAVAKIGENIVLRRFVRFDASGVLQSYIHGDGKIGVLLELSTARMDDSVRTFANDVCLHIAAMNPIALSSDQVDPEVVAKEKEILKAKNLEQGKKPEMIDKIVEGQIRKFLADSVLLEQAFVKNPDQKVRDYLAETGKKVGETFTIRRFVRFELGEGLQKRANNFAEEVAAQARH